MYYALFLLFLRFRRYLAHRVLYIPRSMRTLRAGFYLFSCSTVVVSRVSLRSALCAMQRVLFPFYFLLFTFSFIPRCQSISHQISQSNISITFLYLTCFQGFPDNSRGFKFTLPLLHSIIPRFSTRHTRYQILTPERFRLFC